MKRKTFPLNLSVVAFILLCNVAVAQSCYPTEIIDNAHGTTVTFGYDQNNNVTSMSMKTKQMELDYSIATEKTATGYQRIYTVNNLNPALAAFVMSKSVLSYDNSNRLRLVEGTGEVMSGTEKFIYNVRGQLLRIEQEMKQKDQSGKVLADHGRIEYTYPSETTKNPSEIKIYGIVNGNPELALIETDVLTYDTQKALITDLPFGGDSMRSYGVNNILTANITFVSSNTNVKQSYTYTYNSSGYPASKTYQYSGAANTDTYSYNCK
jgi:hypothetical protein